MKSDIFYCSDHCINKRLWSEVSEGKGHYESINIKKIEVPEFTPSNATIFKGPERPVSKEGNLKGRFSPLSITCSPFIEYRSKILGSWFIVSFQV